MIRKFEQPTQEEIERSDVMISHNPKAAPQIRLPQPNEKAAVKKQY